MKERAKYIGRWILTLMWLCSLCAFIIDPIIYIITGKAVFFYLIDGLKE